MTEWQSVLGYEGHYEVSKTGEVRSLDRVVNRAPRGSFVVKGRLLKTQVNCRSGYEQVGVKLDGKRRTLHVHTIVLEAFVGPRPEGMVGCHGNGDRLDNRLVNLRWDTPSENNYDWVRSGTHHYASRRECKWGHPLPDHELGEARRCPECYADRMRYDTDKRTIIRMLARCGLA